MESRIATSLLPMLLLACQHAPPAPPADPGPAITASIAEGAETLKLARQLVSAPLSSVPWVDHRELVHDTLTLRPDGQWQADAYRDLGGDRIPCLEEGTWSLGEEEPFRLILQLQVSSCPDREPGEANTLRVHPSADGSFRVDVG